MKDRARRSNFNYVAVVGAAFLIQIVLALVNLLRTEDSGTVGIGEVGKGKPVPEFAVPVASSDLDGDANIDPDKACSVEGDDVIRVCDLFDKPLVMSFWFTKGGSACIDQQDIFDDVAKKFKGRVGVLSINVRDNRDQVRELIADHGWTAPNGYDRDGAVSNIYRVGVCPTFIYIKTGGVMKEATTGESSAAELSANIRSLIDASSPG